MIGQTIRDNTKCPKCKRLHNCSYCDDWHYCDCGYWWKVREGKIIAESHKGDVWNPSRLEV